MTETVRCDGCGAVVERETVSFCLETYGRAIAGEVVAPDGEMYEWDHRATAGDLCSACAEPVVAALNEALTTD